MSEIILFTVGLVSSVVICSASFFLVAWVADKE